MYRHLIFYLIALLAACASPASPERIDPTEAYYLNISPQAGTVANNRVEVFVQTYEYTDAVRLAVEDRIFTPDELENIARLGATARANLYITGDHTLFPIAEQINTLIIAAVRGEIDVAAEKLAALLRSLPRRPDPISLTPRSFPHRRNSPDHTSSLLVPDCHS